MLVIKIFQIINMKQINSQFKCKIAKLKVNIPNIVYKFFNNNIQYNLNHIIKKVKLNININNIFKISRSFSHKETILFSLHHLKICKRIRTKDTRV